MPRKNPLKTLTDVAQAGLKVPGAVAGSVVGSVTKVAGVGVGVVTSLLPGDRADAAGPAPAPAPAPVKKAPAKKAPATKAPAKKAPATKAPVKKAAARKAPARKAPARTTPTQESIAGDRPVNVTEVLGLDPSPVDTATPEPMTSIDAAAPEHVDATPADVAEAIARQETTSPPAS